MYFQIVFSIYFLQWMREHWKSDPCYERDFGVNGTLCSFLIYLSEVESWCPRLPGAKHISPQNSVEKNISKVVSNFITYLPSMFVT